METEQTQSPQGNGTGGQAWYSSAEPVLKQSDPEIWSSFEKRISSSREDMAGFIKDAISTTKKLGSSIAPPPLTADPKDIAAFKAKVYQSGHFKAPPDSPEKYEIQHHESNKGLVDKFRSVAFEEGLSQQSVARITGAFNDWIKETALPAMQIDHGKAMESLNAFGAEMKRDPAELMGLADRMMTNLFKDDPEAQKYFENPAANGILKHPSMMKLLAHAALLTGADSGEIGNEMPQEVTFEDAKRIRTDATHPMFAAYHHENDRNHEKAVEIVNRAYQKQIPG